MFEIFLFIIFQAFQNVYIIFCHFLLLLPYQAEISLSLDISLGPAGSRGASPPLFFQKVKSIFSELFFAKKKSPEIFFAKTHFQKYFWRNIFFRNFFDENICGQYFFSPPTALPLDHQGLPFGHQGLPFSHQGVPFGHQDLSFGHQGLTFGHHGLHFGHQGLLFGHQGLSFGHQGLPFSHQGLPWQGKLPSTFAWFVGKNDIQEICGPKGQKFLGKSTLGLSIDHQGLPFSHQGLPFGY